MKQKLLRYYQYFKRAHSSYAVYIIQLINFVIITYTLFLVNFLGLPVKIEYIIAYAVIFVLSYFTTCVVIGWWDYRRGTAPIEMELMWKANPMVRDLFQALYYLTIDDKEKAREVLSKWLESK